MRVFKSFRIGQKNKKSEDKEDKQPKTRASSQSSFIEPNTTTPLSASTSICAQSSKSTHTTPAPRSKSISAEVTPFIYSTPTTPEPEPASELTITSILDRLPTEPSTPENKRHISPQSHSQQVISTATPSAQFETTPSIPTQDFSPYNTPTRSTAPHRQSSGIMSTGYNIPNGVNGVFSPPSSPKAITRTKGRRFSLTSSRPASGNFSATKSWAKRTNGAGSYKIGLVQESTNALMKKSVAELGAGVYQSVSDVSYIHFLEWIRSERLTTLPHKGSRWDKVLIRALYFAEQLHKFDQAIQGFALDSSAAAAIGYGHAKILLELGYENSAALDKAFSVFYKFALSFSSVLQRSELLTATPDVREQLCLLYTDLLSLVVDVSIRFYKTANGMTSGSVSLDIFELFGDSIEAFRTRQNTVVELIWDSQIENEDFDEGEALDVKIISRWLAPQDRVLETLTRDHSFLVDQQVEMTCLWFQKHLSKFIQSDKNFLLVTGQPGAGKTTLAGSIVERLQRPVNRKQVDTLFCSLSPDIPTTATSLAVAKSLLSQLLSLRVGNVAMYHALFKAYHQCRTSTDLKIYEDHLWQALSDTLRQPLDGGNDLVIIVDGLDDIAESQSASIQAAGAISPADLLDKLVTITNSSRRVRLITLASSVKMPQQANGTLHEVTHEDVRDDLHAVALKALAHNHQFHAKPAHEQETLLDRIIQSSNGSFLWTILACEGLNFQKTPDSFTKTIESLETSKLPVKDLVSRLFTSLELSNNAKTLLSWILAAERPLTIEEIHTLFTIDVQKGTVTDKGINVNDTLQTLKPFLTLHEHIVRFRHPVVHSALHDLAIQNKISIPLKDSETDLLLRVLAYAKFTLRDKGEPLLDNSDPNVADKLFHRHRFLEYTVRYWVLHLQQSSLAPKPSGEFKPSSDLQKVFPDTSILPILEQLVWGTQLPVPHAIDLYLLAGTVRRVVFTENSPSVLQTYLATAMSYLLLNDIPNAQKYFYLSTKISRTVLSDHHPLTLECASNFLKITVNLNTTKRTELVTHREEILIILIASYERQYGIKSDLVIQTRKLLLELYASINEEDRALEVYRIIQEATIDQYGRNSHQAHDAEGHLSVLLGKGKGDRHIQDYEDKVFHDGEEDDRVEVFGLASIVAYLRRAESHTARKEVALAERTYVELWQEVSSKCRTSQSVEWHEKNIEIATGYSQFLKTQKRTTEASAILTCVWQQYEHHQLTFSESIVSRLTTVAKEMKSIGSYTTALSIFKHVSTYYKNVRQEESQASLEINQELNTVSAELVKQSLASSSSTTTETTTTVSESVYQDVFFSVIKSSKAVESSTIALAKKLTARYIEQRNYSAAISVIQATLQRTWSSFLSTSIHDVTLTSTFTQESIELVERLAECYLYTKQMEKVEDIYTRFFRAVLVTENVDKTIFEKAKTLLIAFYDKHGYQDNAISVYQDILVAYRTRLGVTHESTIQTLYILARRCQNSPRNHPYWIEYYLQIINSLNGNSEVCHKDALDAIVIVNDTYWADRRYAEAVTIYNVLWKTFVRKTKEHKLFSQTEFVQTLYAHYFQCLEETKASWETLHQVTKEYRETAIATFGAESTIAVEATLSLAQVTQRSEKHISEAIALYEEASKSSKTTTTKTSVSELKQALSSLYIRQMQSSSSSSYKAEHIDRAISMTQEQLTESTSRFGYSHESSLTHLKEIAVLYHRQKKTDVAIKTLNTAVSEIITKENNSQKLIESAASIASCFIAIEQTSTAQSLIQELHRQICAKDSRHASKFSFDLTKSTRSALAFLASLQYNIRMDLSITFSEIMASLTMEYIYFEQFRKTLVNNESLTHILLAAAPLRWFLRQNSQKEMITVVEDQTVGLFVQRDAQDLKTLSKESPRIFIIGILEHLGNGRSKNFTRSVILASNESVSKLTKEKKFTEAYDIAQLGFLYASQSDGYNRPRAISMGFKLASLLVGRNGEKCADAALRKKLLELSNRIVKKIIDICKNLSINFASIQLFELSHLSILLGEQEDYATLEWLLTTLWQTRDAQRSWPAEVLLNLGRRLICARYLAGSPVKAIRLCEDIAYNMRRAHGPRAPVTISTYELLAQLYTSTGLSYQSKAASEKTGPLAQEYFKKALTVHEDILRLVVNEAGSGDDSDDELDTAAYLLAQEGVSVGSSSGSQNGKQTEMLDDNNIDRSALALRHLHLLKLAYQRLGRWPKSYDEYKSLNAQLFRTFGAEAKWKGVQGTETWSVKEFGSGKAESQEGLFEGIDDWALGSDSLILHSHSHLHQNGASSNGAANGTSNGTSNGASNGTSNGLGIGKFAAAENRTAVSVS